MLLLVYGLASGGLLARQGRSGRQGDAEEGGDVAEQLGRLVGQAAGSVKHALREVAPG